MLMTGSSLVKRHLLSTAAGALLGLLVGIDGAAAQSGSARPATTSEAVNRGLVTLVTGRVDSTAARMAADLAELVDDGATRRLLPVLGKGAQQGVTDLRLMRGIDLAILHADAVPDRDRAALTFVMTLGLAELHLLAGAETTSIEALAGKKINVEPAGSGTATTVANLFQKLNLPVEVTNFDAATALEKLGKGEIAALAVVGGKPVPGLAARSLPAGAHFLPVPLAGDLDKTYARATISNEDYPDLVTSGRSVDTIAVPVVLAAATFPPESERYRNIANLVDALFTQFEKLRGPAYHPKWREADVRSELPGWRRFPAAEAWLKRNPVSAPAVAGSDLKEIFVRFLDERSKAGGVALSQQRKDELFGQFQRWREQQQKQQQSSR
jgi:TRAP-type uncharacterized transport system substrate-binding protein